MMAPSRRPRARSPRLLAACALLLTGCPRGPSPGALPAASTSSASAPEATPPARAAAAGPLALHEEELGLGDVRAMLVSSGGGYLYLGMERALLTSGEPLMAMPIRGEALGEAHPVPIGEPPQGKKHDAVDAMVEDRHHRLIVALNRRGTKADELRCSLGVVELEADGKPKPAMTRVPCDASQRDISALAIHPTRDLLYALSSRDAVVRVYSLAGQVALDHGAPLDLRGRGFSSARLLPDGHALYLLGADRLVHVPLDEQGHPGAAEAFPSGKGPFAPAFDLTPQALYLVRPGPADAPSDGRLTVWPLDRAGHPASAPRDLDVPAAFVQVSSGMLWRAVPVADVDTFTSERRFLGYQLEKSPLPTGDGPLPPATVVGPAKRRRVPMVMAAREGGSPLVLAQILPRTVVSNRSRGQTLRATVTKATGRGGAPVSSVKLRLAAGKTVVPLTGETVGEPSGWADLDPILKDDLTQQLVWIQAIPASKREPIEELELTIEVNPGGGAPVWTRRDRVLGSQIGLLVDGYAREPTPGDFEGRELLSEHAKRYLAAAREAAVPPGLRPRLFVVGADHVLGGQGHEQQLRDEAAALGMMGFNTANPAKWAGLPPKLVGSIATESGLRWRSAGVYGPPGYFAFDDRMAPAALDVWAKKQLDELAPSAATPDLLVDFKLGDEPGWHFPVIFDQTRAKAGGVERFRAYLRERSLSPADLGAEGWDKVEFVGVSEATDVPHRRLFYWTVRFFSDEAIRGVSQARAALLRAFGHPLHVDINWNNATGSWYVPSPGKRIGKNRDTGPDAAKGGFDWLAAGRAGSHTMWSEDWFADSSAQEWSQRADLLRSASMLGANDLGGYIIGRTLGQVPEGASYRMFSLVGRGAKIVDFYTFGPRYVFGDGWSENYKAYAPIGRALRRLGAAERLLFPGKPSRSQVAVLLPSVSALWQPTPGLPYFQRELSMLHQALVHSGYSVDYVDEVDLEGGALAARRYQVLYALGPNLSARSQSAVADWVRAGGVVALAPGAVVADELDQPLDTLGSLLKLPRRTAVREVLSNSLPDPGPAVAPASPLPAGLPAAPAGSFFTLGPQAPVPPGPEALARSADAPALSVAPLGSGRVYFYGVFPGFQYGSSPVRPADRLPYRWGELQRWFAALPVLAARVPRPVEVDQPLVEALRLDAPEGTAVILLNWSGRPLPAVSVRVPGAQQRQRASAVEAPSVERTVQGNDLLARLPLDAVDVLLLE